MSPIFCLPQYNQVLPLDVQGTKVDRTCRRVVDLNLRRHSLDSDTQLHLKKLIQIKSQEFEQLLDRQLMERIKISNQVKGKILMNKRTEMGGVRVERTQYKRWGGN